MILMLRHGRAGDAIVACCGRRDSPRRESQTQPSTRQRAREGIFMRAMSSFPIVALLILALSRTSLACLWDNDTLQDERRGLPGMSEILAGKWERHSRYFYEQRAGEMIARLARDPKDLDAYDNLAVAY